MYGILAFVLGADAFAPTDSTWLGVEPTRVFRDDRRRQLELAHLPAWVEFAAGEGRGWTARFDQRTGTVRRMWGTGIPLGRVRTAEEAESAVRRLLAHHSGLSGVSDAELRLRSARFEPVVDSWYVEFDRLVAGVPIWGGGVSARFRGERLVMMRLNTYPEGKVGQAELSAEEAEIEAQLQGPAALGEHTDVSSRLVVLPLDVPGGVDLRLTWEVHSRTEAPLGRWVSFVDAGTGALVNTHNEIRFLTGTVSGTHPVRTLDGEEESTPLPLVEVVGESTAYANGAGAYTVDGDSATTMLRGDYLTVFNASGIDATLEFSEPDPVWDSASASVAEIASYAFVHHVKDWGALIAPEVRMSTAGLTSTVNSTRYTCNAYYDGNLTFFAAGDGCNNTGQIADVNYHEWGHGFHAYAASLGSGGVDGSVGEGAGDVVSIIQTGDSTIAPYFQTNGSGIRDVSRNRSYPDDVTGETHTDGLIFAGAVWDVWEELLTTYGEERSDRGTAWTVVSRLLAGALKGGPTLDTTYEEFVLADDDDGDLTNGTPHLCEIAAGFAPHGLGPLADEDAGSVVLDHVSLLNQPDGSAVTVQGEIVNLLAQCRSFSLDEATLQYSLDAGGSWSTVAALLDGTTITATFPPLPEGSIVSYFLSAKGSAGEAASAPTHGEIAPYTFYVGELDELWCTNLADEAEFTHELVAGEDKEGADDWAHGAPGGQAGDPEDGFTGRRVWGNDLGGDGYNGEYQAKIHNRLTSPAIAADAPEVIIQYRRWLGVEDGYYDQARVLANGEVLWNNFTTNEQVGDQNTQDDEWMLATHRAVPQAGTLTLAWEIESDAGFESGGWNLDDICVYAPVVRADVETGEDTGDENVQEPPPLDLSSDCGCAAQSGADAALAAGMALLALAARRRP